MGTWDSGPFDNDQAADFASDLDELPLDDRPSAIREALEAASTGTGHLDGDIGTTAVAAAALVAAQRPDGPPADPIYGPEQDVPELPDDLRPLALAALDRVTGADSELRELWDEGDAGQKWHAEIDRLRRALAAG